MGRKNPNRDTEPRGYFTTYSLKHPFSQSSGMVGKTLVAVWANQPDLPPRVLADLREAFGQSNSRDPRPLMQAAIAQAERDATPMACIILGK